MELQKGDLDLDALVNLETMFMEYGYEDGMKAGELSGALEGRVLGCEKAFEISRELGYYYGCASTWIMLFQKSPDKFSDRLLKQAQSLQTLIDEIPMENQVNTEILLLVERVRAKFKVLTSILGVSQKYNAMDKPAMAY
ncbi:hypothetical protein BZG36_02274 [Bifiguratus adelaidae]|uniref:Essential protein Yae1 N-terminal domain-containing protein n=1 Tax=Bifiguratus adelaidae TaxID=1938954 RepID=A0A261XY51_9FUNG|nr:hypothetical protein BZG36_02274 [Bifiguratus adelaidae]